MSIRFDRNTLASLKGNAELNILFVPNQFFDNISVKQHFKRKRKNHHGGYQRVLKLISPENMSLPLLLSFNARSILDKVDNLRLLITEKIHVNSCIMLVQESWLHKYIDSNLPSLSDFSMFRVDRNNCSKKTGSGVLTYVNKKLCINPKITDLTV